MPWYWSKKDEGPLAFCVAKPEEKQSMFPMA
jgi:hypothetical protein